MTSVSLSVAYTPAPTVDLTLVGLPAETARLIVTRSWGAVSETVRQQEIPSAGEALVRDYAVPIGRPVTYTVRALSATGQVLDSTVSAPLTVPALADCSQAWVMDELDPARAMLVGLMAGTDEQIDWSSDAAVAFPAGADTGVWLGGVRRASRRFVIRTEDAPEADRLEAMLRPGGVLLFRLNPDSLRHRSGLIRVGASSVDEAPHHPYAGPVLWQVDGPEVAPPSWPTTVPLLTWADLRATVAPGVTWADLLASEPAQTWLQRRIAGG